MPAQGLGMEIVEIRPGQATLKMTVKPHMVNGQRIAHGGFIFTLADSAFAFACNTHNERVVAAEGNITLHPARQAWRRSGGEGTRDLAQRPVRDLRRARHRQ